MSLIRTWIEWLLILGPWILAFGLFVSRNWLLAWLTNSVQHRFNERLEELRAELRANEERFKSELRDKEAEITALRNSVLSGRASRQSLIDKRRFEAVERVWAAVNDMTPYKLLSGMMAALNLKAIAKNAKTPDMQTLFTILQSVVPDQKQLKNVARDEQPFLPELAWGYFSAHQMIVMSGFLVLQVLKLGHDPDEMMEGGNSKKVLKAALPHRSKFIDDNSPQNYYYLLDELERLLLTELRKILEGEEADQASAARGAQILDAIKEFEQKRAQEQAKQAAEVTGLS